MKLMKLVQFPEQRGYIAEKWVDSASSATFDVTNPATIETIATLPEITAADTEKKTTGRQRAGWLRRWYNLCLEHIDDLALILTLENGKPLAEAKGEVTYAASFLNWFAGEAERTHGEVVPAANPNQRILTIKQPLGVAACIAPWNFPIAMITRKVGAALAAGCTTLWKPAGETPLSALAQAVLAQEAGFPKGAINVITTLNNAADIGPSFTGSTRVGKLLAKQCSQNLTKLSLELGGHSPFIVFDDAKIETAVEACLLAKFRNSGQMCVTANRIFVQEGIYDKFTAALVDRIKTLKVGNGIDSGVAIGPLTHDRAVEKAISHINDAKANGASILLGGSACQPDNLQGYSVLSGMSTKSLTTREEDFAPIVALYPFKTEEEVATQANDCDVGLGSFIVTESMPRIWRVAEGLEVGMLSPFGAGYGREGGRHGIDEYLTTKSILMNVMG
ncbi:Aldehyde/histidinol dehydrogenase [Aspergillus pseudodeflectus]|uniref:Aldehyde/histidinol dehydrogenase n=1 Tax=Aspergillus pseudodeflectus TaxID=176178 RepID=A0ABR4KQY4_9EURO